MNATAHQDNRSPRKTRGVYYTPPALADFVAERLLRAAGDDVTRLRVLDPACGDGALLAAVQQQLAAAQGTQKAEKAFDPQRLREIAARQLFGVDRDPRAIERAHQRLLGVAQRGMPAGELRRNFRCGDSLLGSQPATRQSELEELPPTANRFEWRTAFPDVWGTKGGGFDLIVANPPFVNIRRMRQAYDGPTRDWLRRRYLSARGNYDLYVLFIERALELLAPGGRCAMIVPNKLAAQAYATRCRALLRDETTIESIVDVSAARLFPTAGVYPYVVQFQARQPTAQSQLHVLRVPAAARLQNPLSVARPLQSELSEQAFELFGSLDVEQRVATLPLDKVARLHSGASGFAAQQIAEHLHESRADDYRPLADDSELRDGVKPSGAASLSGWEFIVSGNIDRYRIQNGNVRYMKRRYQRPVLDCRCPLTSAKCTLYSEPKIVIAGMTRRLEAAWDAQGRALGVQVYAARDCHVEPGYLLALLNSKLLTYLFRLRFSGKVLAGDYLAINKGPLGQLPIRQIAAGDRTAARRRDALRTLVAERQQTRLPPSEATRIDRQIDHHVAALYGLTSEEQARIDEAIADEARGP